MTRDRGIDKIEEYSGDFLKIIERRIKKKGKVRILEAGCGHGVAMMGFVKRFGNKVEIIGFNYSGKHGDLKRMKKQAIDKGIFTSEELKKIKNMPKILYLDASKKFPFRSNTFDFIYSRAAVYLFDDKIHFLEECNRVLKKDGIARVSAALGKIRKKEQPPECQKGWEIWDKGKKVDPKKYLSRFKGIRNYEKEKIYYLEIKKQPKLDFKLRFIASIDYNFLWHKWMGIKSIYTTQLKFRPHWKR